MSIVRQRFCDMSNPKKPYKIRVKIAKSEIAFPNGLAGVWGRGWNLLGADSKRA